MKNNPHTRRWIKAMRSGNYLQTCEELRSVGATPSFCGLGLLCEISKKKLSKRWLFNDLVWTFMGEDIDCPDEVRKLVGMSVEEHAEIMYLNDDKGKTLKEIGDIVEGMI